MAVKAKTRIAKTFYTKRKLAVPQKEFWPTSFEELEEVLQENDGPYLVIGAGTGQPNVRDDSVVIRTEDLNTFLSFDRESGTARVMAGMTWAQFKTAIRERGVDVGRYRLYPDDVSIGGILSMPTVPAALWEGDIRTNCLGLNVYTPNGAYKYLSAPRKASGPDLRSLYFGSRGAFGVIGDVTLNVFSKQPNIAASWSVDFETARRTIRDAYVAGWVPSWTHYSPNEQTLVIAVQGPERVVDAFRNWAESHDAETSDPNRDVIEKKLKHAAVRRLRFDESSPPCEIVGSSLHGVLATTDQPAEKSSLWFKNLKSALDPDNVFAGGTGD